MGEKNVNRFYGTRKPVEVQKHEFYEDSSIDFRNPGDDKKRYSKLSDKMSKIYEAVGDMAIDRHTLEQFIDFYNDKEGRDEFLGAWIQYITNGEMQNSTPKEEECEEIGFLFSIFYKREETINGKTQTSYIGKAFPALRVEERLSKIKQMGGQGPTLDKRPLFKSFLPFYQEQLLEILNKNDAILEKRGKAAEAINFENLDNNKIASIIETLKGDKWGEIDPMTIEIYVENPVTYHEISKYNFKYNVNNNGSEKWRKEYEDFVERSKSWKVGDLLKESYEKSLEKPSPDYLHHDITFSVNITPQEWRSYFQGAQDPKAHAMKYYLWQNFNFPQSAFKVVIPVDAYNVGQLLKNGDYNLTEDQKKYIDTLLKP
ncbi:MAG: hypothetical protein QM594_13760 [Niabella sp.]